MSEASVPAVPGGLRAGQLGVVVIGRVIMGDIAVTLVDLAQREHLTVTETGHDDDWLLSPSSGPQQGKLLEYEGRLLSALTAVRPEARLSVLASGFGPALDETRKEIVREAVHHGWLRHLHHDQRTPEGEDLARQVRTFQRDLRRLTAGGEQQVLAGDLLPYALHFGLISGDQSPLARFAHAWVRTFADLPGWKQVQPEPPEFDDPIAPATEPASSLVVSMAGVLGTPGWLGSL